MCGIAGAVAALPKTEISDQVWQMVHSLAHRGPDGSGVFAPTHIAMSKKDIESASIAVADYFNVNHDAVDFMSRFLNGDSE